jgi:hypothetical protein
MKIACALLAVAVALTLLLEPLAVAPVQAAPSAEKRKQARWKVQGLTVSVAGDSYTPPLPLTVLNQTEKILNPHESDVVVDTAEGLRLVFHLREYSRAVKVDVIALRDVSLDLKKSTVKKLEKTGKWSWDWGPLFDRITCSGVTGIWASTGWTTTW